MRKSITAFKKADLPICQFYEQYHSVLRTSSNHTKLAFNNRITPFIKRLKSTAANLKIVYLTSNQVFSRESVFIIKKDFKDHQWSDISYSNPDSYRSFINPSIDQFLGQKTEVWERCMSIPHIECKVKRYQQIKVTYTDQDKQSVSQQLYGFKAYLYQHCADHLKGKCVFDWDKCEGNFRVNIQSENFFPTTKFVLRDYSMRIKQALSKRKNLTDQYILNEDDLKLKKTQQEALRKALYQQLAILSEKYGKQ